MIIIFSESIEHTTSYVIDWLTYFNVDYIRINSITDVEIINYSATSKNFIFKYKNHEIDSSRITGFWYRRGIININEIILTTDVKYNTSLNKFLKKEKETLYHFFISSLERNSLNSIGGYFSSDYNKLFQLEMAKMCGLNIPASYILNSSKNLNRNSKYITKSLDTVFDQLEEKTYLMNYTNQIYPKTDMIHSPSFIQECVDKKYEIRAFFLMGKLYSMAIFSQNNSQTQIDFRHYDFKFPNRNVPFLFPKTIKNKITAFMKSIRLNCGSLDFIYTKNHEFVFLEVNPIGQFGMTSQPCNYNLEKIIAKTLMTNEK